MISAKDCLINFCIEGLQKKNLYTNEVYRNRLKEELKEISNQNEFSYFLELLKSNKRYPENQHNLLVPYLLGIVDDFDINKKSAYSQGDFPDVDIDYIPIVRDHLKNNWAPKEFGSDRVCNVGNYSTFAIKSSLIDMARVHGLDRNEILAITTQLGLKDDEGKVLTWEKALEQNKELAAYCNKYPEVSDAARRLVNRNRGRGKHAGGLVISSIPLDNFVPIAVDEDGLPVSAWPEGLNDQDLQPVGLIKFDCLVVSDLYRKALCCKLVKERRGIKSICAVENGSDWSDTSYLNDKKALALAHVGDTKGISQFESSLMRDLLRKGGVNCFDDLAAYTALGRPGPLQFGMTEHYIDRKNYRELYEIHPILEPIVKKTYGILCYQEQVMQVLNVVGKIPLKDCEIVRKAISKKKEKIFAAYKDMFLENGQKVLGWTKEKVESLWNNEIVPFSEYGFNKSHAVAYTFLSSQLLYLKAHYSEEFFTSELICESKDVKIKEAKLDAERHSIAVESISLNKSHIDFSIIDNKIYIGFSKIKGIGKEIAQRIVENQPYKNFEDFLTRFGTEAKVIKPLIFLNCFKNLDAKEYSFEDYLKYYDYFKDFQSKQKAREKRQMDSRAKIYKEISDQCPEVDGKELCELYLSGENFNLTVCEESLKDIDKLLKKYKKSVDGYESKTAVMISMNEFNFSEYNLEDDALIKSLNSIKNNQEAENEFYGFSWKHPMENSPDFDGGKTFSQFEDDEDLITSYVEVHVIEKPTEKVSKKNKDMKYYSIKVEDSDGVQKYVSVWNSDYILFKEEFEYWESDEAKGHYLKLKVKRPPPAYGGYSLYSPPRHLRRRELSEDKEQDFRVIVMERAIND
jgi:DNA polymerase III alpha subunit